MVSQQPRKEAPRCHRLRRSRTGLRGREGDADRRAGLGRGLPPSGPPGSGGDRADGRGCRSVARQPRRCRNGPAPRPSSQACAASAPFPSDRKGIAQLVEARTTAQHRPEKRSARVEGRADFSPARGTSIWLDFFARRYRGRQREENDARPLFRQPRIFRRYPNRESFDQQKNRKLSGGIKLVATLRAAGNCASCIGALDSRACLARYAAICGAEAIHERRPP